MQQYPKAKMPENIAAMMIALVFRNAWKPSLGNSSHTEEYFIAALHLLWAEENC